MENEIIEIKKEKILNVLNREDYNQMKRKELLFLMEVPDNEKKLFEDIINELVSEGKVFITKKGKITTPEKAKVIIGTFLANQKGFGFVTQIDSENPDIFIPAENVNGAMHKDKVYCRIVSKSGNVRRDEGEILKVLQRGINNIVGTFVKRKKLSFVIPDDKKLTKYIYLSKKQSVDLESGDKVTVRIKGVKGSINDDNKFEEKLEGELVEIIGRKDDIGVDILSIIKQFELMLEFPENVLEEIKYIKDEVSEDEKVGRRDIRHIQMVTIDGEDTKDVDDAVTIEQLPNGNFSLGVHIADVTNYVKEGSPLDVEALRRGTSVYLVDRVIPMLPPKLSNGICSLNENVDRLALSCVMEIDSKGTVVSHEIFESLIKVSKRMTYTIVNDLLVDENSVYLDEHIEYMNMFKNMEKLSDILREKRISRGAIEFDFPESKIILDEYGKPIEIKPYERNMATSIIEEFMLACNETVAEEYFWMEAPFVYRSHEEPDSIKMEKLVQFVKNFNYTIKGNASHPKNIQKLLSNIGGKPEETIISRVVLRSFKQAKYTFTNDGHFGLAAKYYCHFTSPIRRYPDLQIHRIIKENLSNSLSETRKQKLNKVLPDICKQCSITERTAEEAERETDNLKKVQFMADKLYEVFDGIISSVTSWGLYISLPNTIEGMVSVSDMYDDYYDFFENHMCFIGEHTRKKYTLGDKVQVKLVSANIEERKINFVFYEPKKIK